jgi:hypothetical protein
MGLWPTEGDEKRLGPATTFYGTVALSFVIPSVPRISYFTALATATYVVLPKENHMQLTEAATLDRKSGGSRGICSSADLSWKCFSTERSGVERSAVSFRALRR